MEDEFGYAPRALSVFCFSRLIFSGCRVFGRVSFVVSVEGSLESEAHHDDDAAVALESRDEGESDSSVAAGCEQAAPKRRSATSLARRQRARRRPAAEHQTLPTHSARRGSSARARGRPFARPLRPCASQCGPVAPTRVSPASPIYGANSRPADLDGSTGAKAFDLGEEVALEPFLARDPVEADERRPSDQAQRRVVDRRAGGEQWRSSHCLCSGVGIRVERIYGEYLG